MHVRSDLHVQVELTGAPRMRAVTLAQDGSRCAVGEREVYELGALEAQRGAAAEEAIADRETLYLSRPGREFELLLVHAVIGYAAGNGPVLTGPYGLQAHVAGAGSFFPSFVPLPSHMLRLTDVELRPGEVHDGWVGFWIPRGKPASLQLRHAAVRVGMCAISLSPRTQPAPASEQGPAERTSEAPAVVHSALAAVRDPARSEGCARRTRIETLQLPLDEEGRLRGQHPSLEGLIERLRACAQWKVAVHAHTDSRGSNAGNLDRSLGWARVVRAQLLSSGVRPEQVRACGYGEYRPVAPSSTEQGRRSNRRVTIRPWDGEATVDEGQCD